MGSIYLARDPKIGNRQVVLKVLREGFDNPEMRERFAREANAAGGLRHVNIVTIFDVGEYEGQPFIAMEYIKGTTLTDVIARREALPMARKLQWMEELCAGLHYAHKAGVVHRDIKPANIMIDEDGLLKIVDFGIARLRSAGTGMTRTGTVMGTLNYMAPEQMAGLPVEAQADIFSFGAVFYEVLSYRKAFPGDFPSIIQKILTAEREPLQTIMPDLDPALTAIVDRCLAKDPADRRTDLNEVRLELAAIRQRIAVDDHLKEERQLKTWLAEAKGDIDRGALTSAALLVERALSVNSSSPDAIAMRKSIDEVRRRLADGQEKTVVLEGALQRARRQLEMGSPDAAMQTVHEALKIDATNSETLLLKAKVDSALTQQQKAEREADRARTVVGEARRQFASGDRQSALNALEGFRPQLPVVTSALAELQVEAREIERRTAAMERQRLEAEVTHLKQEAESETRRLEAEAERQRLQAEVERLKREGQQARRKTETQDPSVSSRVRAAERAGTQRGLVVGGVAAAVVAVAVAGWIFWPASPDVADNVVQAAPERVVEQSPAFTPPPVLSTQPEVPTPAPPITEPVRPVEPAPVAAPPPRAPAPAPAPAPAAAPAAVPQPARGRGQPSARGGNAATRGQTPSTQPTASAPQPAAPQPAAAQPAASAAAADATAAARNREQAQLALDNGARNEAAGDLPTAVQWFERTRQIDPSGPTAASAAESINRVRAQMKKLGTEAFTRGRTNEALGRDEQAIKEFDLAFRYLPDDDPNKQTAKARLDVLRK